MKRQRTLPLLLGLAAAAATAAVPLEWIADVERPSPAPLPVMRGETVDLRAILVRRGRPFDPAADSATFYWQTNGMADVWWSAPASVSSNVLSATFTPAMDPGATLVSAFVGTTGEDGRSYRAWATLRILHAPGAVPNELPLPAPSIDFATVAWTNAPWVMPVDLDAHEADAVKHITAAERMAWNEKQVAIADLETIRSGAAAGATAVQPSALGTAASKDVPASGNASATQVVMGNDTRLSDAREPTAHTHSVDDITLLSGDFFENDLLAADNKGGVVPFRAPQGILAGNNKGEIITFTAPSGVLVGNNGDIVAGTAGLDYVATETDPTVPAWAKAPTPPVAAPAWSSADLGVNPATNLAAATGTAYRWTGSGALSISAVTGLSPDPTYLVLDGFSSLSLPAGFAVAGSGAFRAGREVHLALWTTPTTNFVSFLFAR